MNDKTQNFRPEWELKYFFVERESKIFCLICGQKVVKNLKQNVERHYKLRHESKCETLVGPGRARVLDQLKQNIPNTSVQNLKSTEMNDNILSSAQKRIKSTHVLSLPNTRTTDKCSSDAINRKINKLRNELSIERNLTEVLLQIRKLSLYLILDCKCSRNADIYENLQQINRNFDELIKKRKNCKVLDQSQDVSEDSDEDMTEDTNKEMSERRAEESTEDVTHDMSDERVEEILPNDNQNDFTNYDDSVEDMAEEVLPNSDRNDGTSSESEIEIISETIRPSVTTRTAPKTVPQTQQNQDTNEQNGSNASNDGQYRGGRKRSETRVKDRVFMCDKCGQNFDTFELKYNHLIAIHTKDLIDCYICKEKFINELRLASHLRNRHKIDSKVAKTIADYQWFVCSVCDKKYRHESLFWKHFVCHTAAKTFNCDVRGCKTRFLSQSQLDRHLETHYSKTQFKCNINACNQVFDLNIQLKRHIASKH